MKIYITISAIIFRERILIYISDDFQWRTIKNKEADEGDESSPTELRIFSCVQCLIDKVRIRLFSESSFNLFLFKKKFWEMVFCSKVGWRKIFSTFLNSKFGNKKRSKWDGFRCICWTSKSEETKRSEKFTLNKFSSNSRTVFKTNEWKWMRTIHWNCVHFCTTRENVCKTVIGRNKGYILIDSNWKRLKKSSVINRNVYSFIPFNFIGFANSDGKHVFFVHFESMDI